MDFKVRIDLEEVLFVPHYVRIVSARRDVQSVRGDDGGGFHFYARNVVGVEFLADVLGLVELAVDCERSARARAARHVVQRQIRRLTGIRLAEHDYLSHRDCIVALVELCGGSERNFYLFDLRRGEIGDNRSARAHIALSGVVVLLVGFRFHGNGFATRERKSYSSLFHRFRVGIAVVNHYRADFL